MDKQIKEIYLRALEPEDLDLLYQIENEDEVQAMYLTVDTLF